MGGLHATFAAITGAIPLYANILNACERSGDVLELALPVVVRVSLALLLRVSWANFAPSQPLSHPRRKMDERSESAKGAKETKSRKNNSCQNVPPYDRRVQTGARILDQMEAPAIPTCTLLEAARFSCEDRQWLRPGPYIRC